MSMLMEYKVIREYPNPPQRGKRCKTIYRWSDKEQLKVGGLYANLGPGLPPGTAACFASEDGRRDPGRRIKKARLPE